LQPSELATARPASRVPTPSIKPSAARFDERRVVQRQERLVSAWLRSLTAEPQLAGAGQPSTNRSSASSPASVAR
jgi:hypothetical protein